MDCTVRVILQPEHWEWVALDFDRHPVVYLKQERQSVSVYQPSQVAKWRSRKVGRSLATQTATDPEQRVCGQ